MRKNVKKISTRNSVSPPVPTKNYDVILGDIVGLLETARHASARVVNTVMTATYWEIGRRIVGLEQGGMGRADYGSQIIPRLSTDLTQKYGRGFGVVNLSQMRKFYYLWPEDEIFQTVSEKSPFSNISQRFPLPWSHYVRLFSVKEPDAREHWTNAGENPPVGLILCAEKDTAVAHYALEGLSNKVLAAEYRMRLPEEKILTDELERTQKRLRFRDTSSGAKRKGGRQDVKKGF